MGQVGDTRKTVTVTRTPRKVAQPLPPAAPDRPVKQPEKEKVPA
jgi:hypothetical protein